MADTSQQDSPLSVAANVAGILTFVVAVIAAIYARITYLRNSDKEYFQVKTSLSWYKTESAWLAELVKAAGQNPGVEFQHEYQMYKFLMDDLLRLEDRLLELVEETETKAASDSDGSNGSKWTLVPQSWGFTTAVTVAWLPVRTKALELVRQREALTSRVSFTQMSMISSRIRGLEDRNNSRESVVDGSLESLKDIIQSQKVEVYRLQDLVYHIMHRSWANQDDESPTKSLWSKGNSISKLQTSPELKDRRRRRSAAA